MNVEEIIERLGLKPLEPEGGFFRETYRSDEVIDTGGLPARYGAARSYGTAIYYLLTPETFSALHRVKSDEIFHFYAGDPVRMVQLDPDGEGEIVTLGNDLGAGQIPQHVVRRGVWQGCRLEEGGRFALMGTTVAPGFEYEDFELADREELLRRFPTYKEEILQLARV